MMNFLFRFLAGITLIAIGWFSCIEADFLEYVLVDASWSSWWFSSYMSRFITGSCFTLGSLLVLLPKKSAPVIYSSLVLVFGMLILAILQPFFLGLNRCFVCLSEFEKISRYQGIFIWAFIGALLMGAFITRKNSKSFLPNWATIPITLIALSIPYILNYPAQWAVYGELGEVTIEGKKDIFINKLDTANFVAGNVPYSKSLWQKKHILIMASLSCPFCNRAAYKMHVLKKKNPEFPVIFLLNGDIDGLKYFVKRNVFDNVPYLMLNGKLFNEMCDERVPRIYQIENGVATKEFTYWALLPSSLSNN